MGALLIDSGGKGFHELSALSLSQAQDLQVPNDDLASPGLGKVLDMLREYANDDGQPTEMTVLIRGKGEHAFTFVLKNPSELMEILQYTVGRA